MNMNVDIDNESFYLFARPSFIEGIGRIFDIAGTLNEYNSSLSGVQADRLAFKADVASLRRDIAIARQQILSESSDCK
jgi:hypothetical protein